MRFYGRVG